MKKKNERHICIFLKMPFNGTMNKIRHEHVVVEKMSLKKVTVLNVSWLA